MQIQYAYDAELVLHDGTAVTTSANGSRTHYDVGAAARFPAAAVVEVTAADAADANETYDVIIQGSTDSAFTTPIQLGSMTITRGVTGRRVILFDNQQAGVTYRYIRVRFENGGTTPSISARVFLSQLFPLS
ncbi:MAG: hypothetical protein ACK4E3_03600 [Brevundimonas sp.]|uniref:hypothetical protein n=1 Tax=Brevundimonas sp. TaxID=1871086 RepID=UPI00391B5BD3